ncbi:hypothetical protein Fmac_016061 [Flemingia macrophylla]|uniref:Uncharacterized protein n=1 Tax=Flemingia macrophylla TaxID=520843 RepID=A0ABD1MH56_9FABA
MAQKLEDCNLSTRIAGRILSQSITDWRYEFEENCNTVVGFGTSQPSREVPNLSVLSVRLSQATKIIFGIVTDENGIFTSGVTLCARGRTSQDQLDLV